MNRRFLIPLAALTLSGCITYHTQHDGITRAQFGESVSVDGPTIKPVELLEDSRCAIGTQCVWAGQVRIRIAVTRGSTVDMREIILGKPIPVADGQLELVEVKPEKKAGITLYPEDYRFGFKFVGGL